jgi:four helix bundle protein
MGQEENYMAERIQRFEDFIAWQKARALTARIYGATREGAFSRDFGLRDQIRRAAVSVMSTIAEGFERGKPGEFHHFLCIAKGSCAELRAQLYVAVDVGYVDDSLFRELMEQGEEVGRLVGALRLSVERRRSASDE